MIQSNKEKPEDILESDPPGRYLFGRQEPSLSRALLTQACLLSTWNLKISGQDLSWRFDEIWNKGSLYLGVADLHCAPLKDSQTACVFSSAQHNTAPHQPWPSPTRDTSSSWWPTQHVIHSPGKSMPWPIAHPKSLPCHLFNYGLSVQCGSRTSLHMSTMP